jgi:sugar lactone lactonase YvrE
MSVSVEVFADLHADVGEAPHWDGRTETLLFVDLTGGAVFRYDQSGVKMGSFSVDQEVGAVVPRRGGGLVLAVRDGITRHRVTRPLGRRERWGQRQPPTARRNPRATTHK